MPGGFVPQPTTTTLLLLLPLLAHAVTITNITPNEGSVVGGTVVRIEGSGFQRGGTEGTTQVYFGPNECRTIPYYSDDNVITCVTPPHSAYATARVTVDVVFIQVDAAGSAACNTDCRFQYRTDATPTVSGLQTDFIAGEDVTFYGNLRANTPDRFTALVADTHCHISEDNNPEELEWSSGYTLACTPSEQVAGRYNMTLAVSPNPANDFGYGYADLGHQVDPVTGDKWITTVRPRVADVDSHTGGALGGATIRIKGTGFDPVPANNAVTISGSPCAVTHAEATLLECVTGPYAGPAIASGQYPGSAGLLTSLFAATTSFTATNVPDAPTSATVTNRGAVGAQGGAGFNRRLADNYVDTVRGFFVPPVDGNYSFYLRGDDVYTLYLSPDAHPDNATAIVSYSRATASYFTDLSQQHSDVRALSAGTPYYFDLWHQEGGGDDYVDVACRIHGMEDPAVQAVEAFPVRERQSIAFTSSVASEVQTLTLENAASGMWAVSIASDGDTGAKLSGKLEWDASASDVRNALRSARPGGCNSISVTRSDVLSADATPVLIGHTWSVSLQCARTTPYPVMVVVNRGLGSSGALRFDNSQTTSGTYLSGSFRLSIPGLPCDDDPLTEDVPPCWTQALPPSASSSAVASALASLGSDVSVSVGRSGNSLTNPSWSLVFESPVDDIPTVVVNATEMVGDGFSHSVTTREDGSANDVFLSPCPPDYFQLQSALPVVSVTTNGVLATCLEPVAAPGRASGEAPPTLADAGNCNYVYDASLTGTVTSYSPASVTAGGALTISGTGFTAPTGSSTTVAIGTTPCAVTASSDTEITCTVGQGPSGNFTLAVTAGYNGLAKNSLALAAVAYTRRVDTVSPVVGSTQGGTVLTITGAGFTGDDVIAVDGVPCVIVAVTDSSTVTCTTGAHAAAAGLSVTVAGVGVATYEYAASHTPAVTAITPTELSWALTPSMTWSIGNTGATTMTSAPVLSVDGANCHVDSWSQDAGTGVLTVICHIHHAQPEGTSPAAATLAVYVPNLGNGDVSGAPTTSRRFDVEDVQPRTVGRIGGAVLTISGAGFPEASHMGMITVKVPEGNCTVLTTSYTAITCQIVNHHTPEDLLTGDEVGEDDMSGNDEHSHRRLLRRKLGLREDHPDSFVDSLAKLANLHREFEAVAPHARRLSSAPSLLGEVVVTVNAITAQCASNCNLTQTEDVTPVVNAVETTPGQVNVTGTRLGATGGNVFVGKLPCPILAAQSTDAVNDTDGRLVCDAAAVLEPASTQPVRVTVDGVGFAHIADNVTATYTFPLTVTGITCSGNQHGSTQGGQTCTVSGSGFVPVHVVDGESVVNSASFSGVPATQVVTVGGTAATIVSATTTSAVIVTPAYDGPLSGAETAVVAVASSVTSGWANDAEATFTDSLDAAYTYDASVTGAVTGVDTSTVTRGDTIVISGSGFGATQGASEVTVGDTAVCDAAAGSWADDSITCVVGDVSAGVNTLRVKVDPWGYTTVASSATLTKTLVVGGLSATSGSFGGDQVLTLSGEGFSHAHRMSVSVCGAPATITASSYDSVSFETPPLDTLEAIEAFEHVLPSSLSGTVVSRSASNTANVFDGNVENYGQGSNGVCWFGMDFGTEALVAVTRVRVYPRLKYASRVQHAMIEASTDADCGSSSSTSTAAWTQVAVFSGTITEGWNWIDIDEDADATARPLYRCLRYRGGTSCNVGELDFIGYKVSTHTNGTCDVDVSVAAEAARSGSEGGTSIDEYRYTVDATPHLNTLFPDYGTALGGTTVTISGANFDTDAGAVTVDINGVDCPVDAATPTAMTCTTLPRGRTFRDFTASVSSPNTGKALRRASEQTLFRYLDRWSDVTTWENQQLPVEGDSVIIPHGQALLVDVTPPRQWLIMVQGVLIFDNSPTADIELDCTYLFVFGGVLEVGTEATPYAGKATITLHGDRWTTIELPTVGAKGLTVTDYPFVTHSHTGEGDHGDGTHGTHASDPDFRAGTLDLHGADLRRSWVKLGEGAYPVGATVLELGSEVDWEVGATIIVTSSNTAAGNAEVEEHVIASRPSATSVEVEGSGLAHARQSEVYDYNGRLVDLRPEVALLTRNVKVQGNEASNAQLFGVHTMAAHAAIYRLEGVEFTRCGQSGVLGRYCTHFHMMGSRPENYVRNCAIHHSFQRAVVVHASDDVTVAHNVAYDVRGHTFFVEDGNEQRSLFDENLGVKTVPHNQLLGSDGSPATFWTPTPRCFWRNNVAAGSASHGMWFELVGRPTGPSHASSGHMCPSSDRVGDFRNNTFHSNGGNGLRVYPHWSPKVDCGGEHDPQELHTLTSWRNGLGVFHRDVGSLHHMDYNLVENGGREVTWKKLTGISGMQWRSHYQNLLAIGSRDAGSPKGGGAVIGPQTEHWYIGPATFVNYAGGVLSGCTACASQTSLKQGGYTFRFEGLTFDNSPVRTGWTAPFKQIFWDLDGSLTGHVNGTTSPYWSFNDRGAGASCSRGDATYQNGIVCDATTPLRRLVLDGVEPRELDFQNIQVSSGAGVGTDVVGFLPKEHYGWVLPVAGGDRFHAHWDSLVDWQSMRMKWGRPEYIKEGEWIGFSSDYIDYRLEYEVLYGGDWIAPLGRLPLPTDDLGKGAMGYLDHSLPNGTWHMIMNTVNDYHENDAQHQVDVNALQCPRIVGCPLPPPPTLGEEKFWSDPASWEGGLKPVEGQDLVIGPTEWFLLNESPPRLGHVRIEGRLDFFDDKDLVLECDSITVFGTLTVGTRETPFSHDARIRVHGIRTSPTVVVDNAHFLGNKVIAVFGEVSMVGFHTPATTHVALGATASPGDATVTTAVDVEALGWRPNTDIILTPTEYFDPDHVEVVRMTTQRDGGTTLDIDPATPIAHTHLSVDVDTGAAAERLTARAASLWRNVVVEGADPQGDPNTPNYGVHIVVGEIQREVPIEGADGTQHFEYVGHADFYGVQFDHVGKMATEHPGVKYKYLLDESPTDNVIENCVFSNAYNYAVVAENAKNIALLGNVVHGGYRSGFDFDRTSTAADVQRNLISGTQRSPDDLPNWVHPFASFFFDNAPATFKDNVAAGSGDAGFTVRAPACGSDAFSSGRWGNNEAVGAMVGAFLLPWKAPGGCQAWESFKAWKCSHVGVLSVDTSDDVHVGGVVLADNHIGLSLNFVGTKVFGHESTLTDSLVMGSTPASTCAASVDCRAQSEGDLFGQSCGSVLGSTYRRVGVMAVQHTGAFKTCDRHGGLPVCRPPNRPERLCSLPWEKRYGTVGVDQASFRMTNVRFAHWNTTDCGRLSTAIMPNPSQIDYTAAMYLNGIAWHNVQNEAKLFFGLAPTTPATCDSPGCDSYNYAVIRDEDGSVAGTNNGVIIANTNPGMTRPSPACAEVNGWGAFLCPALQNLRPMMAKARFGVDPGREIGPFIIKRVDPELGNRSYASQGPYKEPCSKQSGPPQFPWLIAPGYNYEMRASGTVSSTMRFYYTSPDPSEAILVRMFLQRPNALEFFVNGRKIVQQDHLPELSDPAGTFMFHPQERHVYFVVRGGADNQIYDMVRTPKVQVSVRLALSVEEFFNDEEMVVNNIATLLDIPAHRIRVVSVQPGSAEVQFEIVADTEGLDPTEDAAVEALYDDVEAIAANITALVQDGAFDIGVPVEEVPLLGVDRIDTENATELVAVPPKPVDPGAGGSEAGDDGFPWVWVVGAAVVGGAAGVSVYAFVLFRRRASKGHKVMDDGNFQLSNPMGGPVGVSKPESKAEPVREPAGEPGGEWSKFWDATHKRFYWYSPTTQMSRWTPPPGWVEPARKHDWHQVWDDTQARAYWFSETTGETTWTKPQAVREEDRDRQAAGLSPVVVSPPQQGFKPTSSGVEAV